jgi:hypothetical protein
MNNNEILLSNLSEEDKEHQEKNEKNEFKESLGFLSTVPYSNITNGNDNERNQTKDKSELVFNNNPFILIINDLEERIAMFENLVKEKEHEIEGLKVTIAEHNKNSEIERENLIREIETLKGKYVNAISEKKTLTEEFNNLYEKRVEKSKKDGEKSIYELEKKILHLEKFNVKYEADFEKLAKMNTDSENAKSGEIENLKNNIKIIVDNYEGLYKAYEENLKTLIKQIDAIKQLYIARENEFINITNYYTETINDYSKPLSEMNNLNNFRTLEDNFIRQNKEVEDLKKKLEQYIIENAELKSQIIEFKPKLRQKISNSMNIYEDNIKDILQNQHTLITKLDNINNFIMFFDTKLTFFNGLLEENKKLEDKINQLDLEIKISNSDGLSKENISLKEINFRLSRDLELKNNEIMQIKQLTPRNSFDNKNKKKNISFNNEDIIYKLKNEINNLSNNIVNLNKVKENLENFYQTELKNAMNKIDEKNDKIDELKGIIQKMENDNSNRKETILNLWMLEFKEFKNNLLTIKEIKELVDKFNINGEELSMHKDKIASEELYLIREEMKGKDLIYEEAKNNFENERKKLKDLIEIHKKNIEGKCNTYDILIKEKEIELDAFKKEKMRLVGIEESKKKVKRFFNYLVN